VSEQTLSQGCGTSHAAAVSRVHGSHRLRDSGRAAHAALVDGTHAKHIGAALHQAGDGETGKFNWSLIALEPVGGSDLTSAHIFQYMLLGFHSNVSIMNMCKTFRVCDILLYFFLFGKIFVH